jgi:hypothetical protein
MKSARISQSDMARRLGCLPGTVTAIFLERRTHTRLVASIHKELGKPPPVAVTSFDEGLHRLIHSWPSLTEQQRAAIAVVLGQHAVENAEKSPNAACAANAPTLTTLGSSASMRSEILAGAASPTTAVNAEMRCRTQSDELATAVAQAIRRGARTIGGQRLSSGSGAAEPSVGGTRGGGSLAADAVTADAATTRNG